MTAPAQNDLDAIARSRVAEQYKESTRLLDTLSLFVAELTEVQAIAFETLAIWNLDDATGWSLDVIGRMVGLERPFLPAEIFGYFGYAPYATAESYGDEGVRETGGRYISVRGGEEGQVLMEDEDYRLHIRAQILRNKTSAKPEEVLEIIHTVIPDLPATEIVYLGLASVRLTFLRLLSTIERGLISGTELIPRPAGVSADYAEVEYPPFGYAGSPDAAAYGTGHYAAIF